MCSGFETGLDGWNLRLDSSVASVEAVSSAARSGAQSLAIDPVDTAAAGGSYARRTVVLPDGVEGVAVRAWIWFGADGGADWFMNVLAITNDSGAVWNVDARPASDGGVALSTYHQDESGNAAGDERNIAITANNWHCVMFSVTPSRATVVGVAVDSEAVAVIDEPIAATITGVVTASIGPAWLSPADQAPSLRIDDVAIGTPGVVTC